MAGTVYNVAPFHLLRSICQVKLGDYGCISAKQAVGRTNANDLLWTAPELLEEMLQTGKPASCTSAGDIYSLGIIIVEILTRKRAYLGSGHAASSKA